MESVGFGCGHGQPVAWSSCSFTSATVCAGTRMKIAGTVNDCCCCEVLAALKARASRHVGGGLIDAIGCINQMHVPADAVSQCSLGREVSMH